MYILILLNLYTDIRYVYKLSNKTYIYIYILYTCIMMCKQCNNHVTPMFNKHTVFNQFLHVQAHSVSPLDRLLR